MFILTLPNQHEYFRLNEKKEKKKKINNYSIENGKKSSTNQFF